MNSLFELINYSSFTLLHHQITGPSQTIIFS